MDEMTNLDRRTRKRKRRRENLFESGNRGWGRERKGNDKKVDFYNTKKS